MTRPRGAPLNFRVRAVRRACNLRLELRAHATRPFAQARALLALEIPRRFEPFDDIVDRLCSRERPR